MAYRYDFHDVGRFPATGDNVAIATCRIDAGSEINDNGARFTIPHTILEGHRFAVKVIPEGEVLLSWELPFGVAITRMRPGDYVCNQKILDALALRNIDFALPSRPNFKDQITPYVLDEAEFQPGTQVPRHEHDRSFLGYRRDGGRGVGTRNYIVLMGTTSRSSGYAKTLADRFKGVAAKSKNIDGIVAVTHTEGGEDTSPNNLELLLRTLAGFTVHPNVGAILAVDYGTEAVTNQMLQRYMHEHNYPLDAVLHQFFSMQGSFDASLDKGESIVRGWLDPVNAMERTEQSLSNLKIALQCGGSDAFSGVSGNPLAAYVAKEVIRYGGCANLAETDELIGAERYVLQNVKDLETAQKFLDTIERFNERASWHGQTAEANPSGGNNFRGLYNIVIKSIGAAMKRHPDVRLDAVIEYGEMMLESGYYFMDSPGNDLESIAGQVASGSNMIFFVTGNGSITNFPFVPTIKIVTTTGRYNLLKNDMDVNAGAYQDGTPMEALGQDMLDLTVKVASGEPSVGEQAGHSQVSIWRNWRQTAAADVDAIVAAQRTDGKPIPIRIDVPPTDLTFNAIQAANGYRSDQIGLILPTSLCSGQIAQMIADRLNEKALGRDQGISRFVALAHTEGCGVSGGNSEEIYTRTLIGHLIHPIVALGVPLEHGCEKTHNDYIRHALAEQSLPIEQYGWASVQLDGGIDAVIQRVEDWFRQALASMPPPNYADVGLENLRVGLVSSGKATEAIAQSLAHLTQTIVGAGGTVVVPANTTCLTSPAYVTRVFGDRPVRNTLAYGQSLATTGFHIMETPTDHVVETLTGLGATGVDVMLVHVVGHPLQAHRMIPLIQATADATTQSIYHEDLDLLPPQPDWTPESFSAQMLESILQVASRCYTPKLYGKGNTDFQFTRGLLGISM
ncbi:MAG: UxaA family hydrolase [Candidatus Poribacteria bacterium]|nr:UxaA family hydrolase [Candidatus Poribacteria bacterium]